MGVYLVLKTLFLGAIVAAVYLFREAARRQGDVRRSALAGLADASGLTFHAHGPVDDPKALFSEGSGAGRLLARYADFDPFDRIPHASIHWLMEGRRGDLCWTLFELSDADDQRYTAVACATPMWLPFIEIRPRGTAGSLRSTGAEEVRFESHEFDRRYRVLAVDPRLASAVLGPAAIEQLLCGPDFHWQIARNQVLVVEKGVRTPEQLGEIAASIRQFVEAIPEFLRQDMPSMM